MSERIKSIGGGSLTVRSPQRRSANSSLWLCVFCALLGISMEARAEGAKFRVAKTRIIRVTVTDSGGNALKDAEVSIQEAATKSPLQGQNYHVGSDGSTRIVVQNSPEVELVVTAPGYQIQKQVVYWATEYVFHLRLPSGDTFPQPEYSAPSPKVVTPVAAVEERKTRTITVVVEGEGGNRLKDAEVAVLNAVSKKIHERKLLVEGLGMFEIESDPSSEMDILATVPGHVTDSHKLGKDETYVFRLKRRESQVKMKVMVRDAIGRKVAKASVLATEDGRERGRAATDDQGLAEVAFSFSDDSGLVLEVHHGGYQSRKTPVRLPRDESLEVVLLPAKPVVKSTFVVVVALSKSFTSSRAVYNRVREALGRIIDESVQHPDIWKDLGVLGLGDGRIREILPLTKEVDEALAKQSKTALGGLEPYAGTLNWRDLETLADFLNKSGRVSEAGCDVLVLAPKNMAMDESLSLYDSGGEPLVDNFRSKNLRLRLVEIGMGEDNSRAYQELCERTQGFYKALKSGDNLIQDLMEIQFHYPAPPPSTKNRAEK